MGSVFKALGLALGQLADGAVLRVLAKSIAITLAVFVAAATGLYYALVGLFDRLAWETGGLAEAATAALIAIVAFWFLFRVVAVAVLQFFADEVVLAVERKHYPEASQSARKLPFREDMANSMKGVARALAFNAMAAPIALVLVFTAIGPAIVFLIVNAVLLGRELTDMAWLRHRHTSKTLSPVSAPQRFVLGGVIAGLMLVPFANFLAPVIGAAAGTHLVHRTMQRKHA